MLKTPQEVEKTITNTFFSETDKIVEDFLLEMKNFVDKLKARIK